MLNQDDPARRRALGEFVRVQRQALAPGDIGLSAGARRRTPGLRREEAAQLCGLSTTWYTWIEQGREVSVSPAALGRLATGLRLGRAERAYLFELAGKRDPAADAAADPVNPAILGCVDRISCPAYVLDRAWNALEWNAPGLRLFAGWLDRPGERNLLRFIFLEPAARQLINEWEQRARRVVAEFRAHAGSSLNDPVISQLVENLRQESADFARIWQQHLVLGRDGGVRDFDHPEDGFVRFNQVTFSLAGQPGIRLTMLVPLGSEPKP